MVLEKRSRTIVGADLSCTSPIYLPSYDHYSTYALRYQNTAFLVSCIMLHVSI